MVEFEFEEPVRIDLIGGNLYIVDKHSNTIRKIEGVSSVQVWTEGKDRYPIGIIRKGGSLYHVVRLKIAPEKYAVAEVKTRG